MFPLSSVFLIHIPFHKAQWQFLWYCFNMYMFHGVESAPCQFDYKLNNFGLRCHYSKNQWKEGSRQDNLRSIRVH